LPVFDNKEFLKTFGNHISNTTFGGRDIDTETDWNSLDARGDNGIRGTEKRRLKMANLLASYRDSLKEGEYNFEGSPFSNLDDLKTRINNAIAALDTPDINDDTEALNAIGLRASDWFSDGSGDLSGKVDSAGNPLTYSELSEYNKQLAKQKEEEQRNKVIADYNKKYKGIYRSHPSIVGMSPSELGKLYKTDADLISTL
jgi:hypothetical protein